MVRISEKKIKEEFVTTLPKYKPFLPKETQIFRPQAERKVQLARKCKKVVLNPGLFSILIKM